MKSRIRLFILISVLLFSSIVTLNKVNLPIVNKKYDNNFSALNVIDDIRFISKEPHSVKHPEERSRVRDYLFDRLNSLGMKTEYLRYDSVKDRFGEYNDIANLYAVSEPSNGRKAKSYLLLMAHLDSRFSITKRGKRVTSFGAADDGYGLGVILELIRVSNYYKGDWNQGLKVLFTDSEESNLEGIKSTIKYDKRVFDNVGFIINLEARGIKGPAVMFETSPGNSGISELYSKGGTLYSYSFTSAIYNILPNYTDFTLIKNDYPGINFAVIDNLNYYHTDLDNFDNISLNSIQHYGNQTYPIVKEYLTNNKYADPLFLKDNSNSFYLSLPLIGFIKLHSRQYYLLFLIIITLFITVLFTRLKKEKNYSKFLKSIFIVFSSIIIIAGLGLLISYLTAIFNGIEFNLIYLPFIKGDNIIFIVSLIFVLSFLLLVYRFLKVKLNTDFKEVHLSSLLLIVIFTLLSHIFTGDSILFAFVLFFSFISYLLNSYRILSKFSVLSVFPILIYSIPVVYLLNVALTIGALSIVLSYVSVIFWQFIPIADGYLKRDI
ncbi:hypothetical protein MASR2M69_24780 [Bacteroidota bacterium]